MWPSSSFSYSWPATGVSVPGNAAGSQGGWTPQQVQQYYSSPEYKAWMLYYQKHGYPAVTAAAPSAQYGYGGAAPGTGYYPSVSVPTSAAIQAAPMTPAVRAATATAERMTKEALAASGGPGGEKRGRSRWQSGAGAGSVGGAGAGGAGGFGGAAGAGAGAGAGVGTSASAGTVGAVAASRNLVASRSPYPSYATVAAGSSRPPPPASSRPSSLPPTLPEHSHLGGSAYRPAADAPPAQKRQRWGASRSPSPTPPSGTRDYIPLDAGSPTGKMDKALTAKQRKLEQKLLQKQQQRERKQKAKLLKQQKQKAKQKAKKQAFDSIGAEADTSLHSAVARAKRAARFTDSLSAGRSASKKKGPRSREDLIEAGLMSIGWDADVELDWDAMAIKGTCQTLEKRYLRLTAPPDPSTVRPESVLHRALDWVKQLWRNKTSYLYVCDQLKSIRQDLTIQLIKNEFSVRVYETHARIALEKGDANEFNQCQTQLTPLYQSGLPGSHMEFLAYKVLYFSAMQSNSEAASLLSTLTPEQENNSAVQHALKVRAVVATDNYHRFFQLYDEAPNMSTWVMDLMSHRIRMAAFSTMAKAYRPSLKLSFVTTALRFPSEDDCIALLTAAGGITSTAPGSADVVWDTGRSKMQYVRQPQPTEEEK